MRKQHMSVGMRSCVQPVSGDLPVACFLSSTQADQILSAVLLAAKLHHAAELQEPESAREGLGGTYFFKDASAVQTAIFKPCDEEPLAPNNPKVVLACAPPWLVERRDLVSALQLNVCTLGHLQAAERTSSKSQGFVGRQLGDAGLKPTVRVGEAAMREVAAFLLDDLHFAHVPPTWLVKITNPCFHVAQPARSMEVLTRGSAQANVLSARHEAGLAAEPEVSSAEAAAAAAVSTDRPALPPGPDQDLLQQEQVDRSAAPEGKNPSQASSDVASGLPGRLSWSLAELSSESDSLSIDSTASAPSRVGALSCIVAAPNRTGGPSCLSACCTGIGRGGCRVAGSQLGCVEEHSLLEGDAQAQANCPPADRQQVAASWKSSDAGPRRFSLRGWTPVRRGLPHDGGASLKGAASLLGQPSLEHVYSSRIAADWGAAEEGAVPASTPAEGSSQSSQGTPGRGLSRSLDIARPPSQYGFAPAEASGEARDAVQTRAPPQGRASILGLSLGGNSSSKARAAVAGAAVAVPLGGGSSRRAPAAATGAAAPLRDLHFQQEQAQGCLVSDHVLGPTKLGSLQQFVQHDGDTSEMGASRWAAGRMVLGVAFRLDALVHCTLVACCCIKTLRAAANAWQHWTSCDGQPAVPTLTVLCRYSAKDVHRIGILDIR